MKQYDEWWEENDYLYGQPIAYDEMQQCFNDGRLLGRKEGMLAAADIAWKGKIEFPGEDGPHDEWAQTCKDIALQIREAAE